MKTMAYQFNKEERVKAANALASIRQSLEIRNHSSTYPITQSYISAIDFAIKELLRPNPCDNCVGVGLAVSRGYTDMRLRTEEDS